MIYIENRENPLKIENFEWNDAVFTTEANEQAKIASKMRIAAQFHSRLDLRGKTIFTFSDSLDHFLPRSSKPVYKEDSGYLENGRTDCAFSLDKSKEIYTLGLHIADVDEYVCEGSPLDLEAKKRGITISTPLKSLPMTHENIWRGVCSLKEREDRLAVSIFLKIDEKGKLLDIYFEESIVQIARNCVFSEIDKLYNSSDSSCVLPLKDKYATLLYNLNELYALGAILYSARISAGGLDFKNYQKVFLFNESGEAIAVEIKPEFDSMLLIREFLIFASMSLARFFKQQAMPCIYFNRTIKRKDLAKMANVSNYCDFDKNTSDQSLFNGIFQGAKDSHLAELLFLFAQNILQTEEYSTTPLPHWLFGTDMISFSNPTNKFSDLFVQRLMKTFIKAHGETRNINLASVRKKTVEAVTIANTASKQNSAIVFFFAEHFSKQSLVKSMEKEQTAYIIAFKKGKVEILLENGIKGILLSNDIESADGRSAVFKSERLTIGQRIMVYPDTFSVDTSENIFKM